MSRARRLAASSSAVALACAACVACAACASGANDPRDGGDPRGGAAASTSATGAAQPGSAPPVPAVREIAALEPAPSMLSIEPIASTGAGAVARRGLLVVARVPGPAGLDRTWARRFDASTQTFGRALDLGDANVLAAFDEADGALVLATTHGAKTCLARYAATPTTPTTPTTPSAGAPDGPADPDPPTSPVKRACTDARVHDAVRADGSYALVELRTEGPPAPAQPAAHAGAKPTKSSKTSKSAQAAPAKGTKPRERLEQAKQRRKARLATAAPTSANAKKSSSKKAAAKPAPKVFVEIALRPVAASLDAGAIGAGKPTGVRFERVREGVAFVDAEGRPEGVELLWYERGKKPLGRLIAATVGPSGAVDPKSRAIVAEAEMLFSALRGHPRPRLVGTPDGVAFVSPTGGGRGCEVARLRPGPAPRVTQVAPSGTACAVDLGAAVEAGVAALDAGAAAALLALEPRAAYAQHANDVGLVAWAGDKGLFHDAAGALRVVARGPGALAERALEAPLAARRADVAWAAFEPTGEGAALAPRALVTVDAAGDAAGALAPEAPVLDAAARARLAAGAFAAPTLGAHVARVGDRWLVAAGDVLDASVPTDAGHAGLASLAGLAPLDASAIVGGREKGLFFTLRDGALDVFALAASGGGGSFAATRVGSVASPVARGFAAARRGLGGALLVGPGAGAAGAAGATVAVSVAADGTFGVARALSAPLALAAGQPDLRVVASPRGGAVAFAGLGARSGAAVPVRAVWLDDDGREVAVAPWPGARVALACAGSGEDRATAPTSHWPSPTPGVFVEVPDELRGRCWISTPAFAPDGTLRVFTERREGLESRAELVVVRVNAAPAASSPSASASAGKSTSAPAAAKREPACPPDMVSVAGAYCVDRFEARLADVAADQPLSPDYPATPGLVGYALAEWATGRLATGDARARSMPLPFLPPAQRAGTGPVRARSRAGARPSGYVSGNVAEAACAAAGKRLCTHAEFVVACRGEADTQFPYGDDYEAGVCNATRDDHPAAALHDNASVGHLDPRLNRVVAPDGPMLRETGELARCASRWGDDAVFDMVGNLDEWVADGAGAFAGGFYARSTKAGCEALITAHPRGYQDYSTGARCCRDATASD